LDQYKDSTISKSDQIRIDAKIFEFYSFDNLQLFIIKSHVSKVNINVTMLAQEIIDVSHTKFENRLLTNFHFKFIKESVKGGKQAFKILKAEINNYIFAIKFYKGNIIKLFIHIIASIQNDNISWKKFDYKLKIPKTLGIGLITLKNKKTPILLAEWAEGDELQTLIKLNQKIPRISPYAKILSKRGLILDPFLKNFILNEKNQMIYLDLLSLNLSNENQEIVKSWMQRII